MLLKIKNSKLLQDFLSLTILLFLVCNLIFARSFNGIYISGFRIGELSILGGVIISLLSIFYFKKDIFKNISVINMLIIISFFIISIINSGNFMEPNTDRYSSYIWTMSYIYVAFLITKSIDVYVYKIYFPILLLPLLTYTMATGNYPNFFIEIFNKRSDKFQFLKATDLLIALVICYFLYKNLEIKKINKLIYLFFISGLFLPLFSILSRGSYISLILLLMLECIFEKNYLIKNIKHTLFLVTLLAVTFVLSTFRVNGVSFFDSSNNLPVEVVENVSSVIQHKDTTKAFLTFYVQDGRLFSKDETTNWRLDIWQDIFFDMLQENKLIKGYGYNEILPQMTDPSAPGRLGRDGLNVHVHNYFMTIFSRGGLIQLSFFLYFYYLVIKLWLKKYKNYNILSFLFPILLASSLDISMDGVQFPILFFSSLGYFLNSKKLANTN